MPSPTDRYANSSGAACSSVRPPAASSLIALKSPVLLERCRLAGLRGGGSVEEDELEGIETVKGAYELITSKL